MSAVKHGFFRPGFMICDRCILNGKCESFVPAGECSIEKKLHDEVLSELMEQNDLNGLVDEILARRVVMYLIRIARVESYEANVGVSDSSVIMGKYIADLDKTLRALLKDLALLRADRKRLEKNDVLVGVDQLLAGLSEHEGRTRRIRQSSLRRTVLKDWRKDRARLLRIVRSDDGFEG